MFFLFESSSSGGHMSEVKAKMSICANGYSK